MRWLFNVGARHILPVCGNDTGSCPTNTRSNTFYFTQFPSKNNANACAFVIVWAIALGWYWRQNRGLPFEDNQSLRFNFTHLIIGRIFHRLDGLWLHLFQTLFLHCPQLLRVVWGGSARWAVGFFLEAIPPLSWLPLTSWKAKVISHYVNTCHRTQTKCIPGSDSWPSQTRKRQWSYNYSPNMLLCKFCKMFGHVNIVRGSLSSKRWA